MYESLVTLSTFLAWAALLFTRKQAIPLLEAGASVLAVLMIGIASLFSQEVRPLIPALQSYWLHLHVSIAFVGEACFALSFILSYLYCLRSLLAGPVKSSGDRGSKETLPPLEKASCIFVVVGLPLLLLTGMIMLILKKIRQSEASAAWISLAVWGIFPIALLILALLTMSYLYRGTAGKAADRWLPTPQVLDELTYRAVALGYPLFTVGAIIFGMVWANKAWGRYWGWDPKETWAFITFLVYSLYLHVRLTRGWKGTWTAMLSIIGFLVTMFTLFGVNLLISGLHSYAY